MISNESPSHERSNEEEKEEFTSVFSVRSEPLGASSEVLESSKKSKKKRKKKKETCEEIIARIDATQGFENKMPIVEKGLGMYPDSQELLHRKARILMVQGGKDGCELAMRIFAKLEVSSKGDLICSWHAFQKNVAQKFASFDDPQDKKLYKAVMLLIIGEKCKDLKEQVSLTERM